MTINIAFFADLGEGLTSYPTDGHMQEVFKDLLSKAKNEVQVVVKRDGNLLHYGYIRKLDEGKSFGICVSMPGVVCNMERWFDHLDNAYTILVTKGTIVHLSSNGKLDIANNSLPAEKMQLELLSDALLTDISSDKTLIYKPLPTASISVSLQTVATHSLEDGSEAIRSSLAKYYNIYITRTNAEVELVTSYSHTLRTQYNKIIELEKQIDSLNRKKKQFSLVIILSVGLMLVAVIAVVLISGKNREIDEKNVNIRQMEESIDGKNAVISHQFNKIDSLNKRIKVITGYAYMVGASPRREGANRDNEWIMWLRARQPVRINYFYIESSNSGYVTLSLCSEASEEIASQEFYIPSSCTWIKIRPDGFTMSEPGYYYMRISQANGHKLRWHSSNDEEYSRYRVGALEITGCCNYTSKDKPESKNYTSYYQYFYNINYTII